MQSFLIIFFLWLRYLKIFLYSTIWKLWWMFDFVVFLIHNDFFKNWVMQPQLFVCQNEIEKFFLFKIFYTFCNNKSYLACARIYLIYIELLICNTKLFVIQQLKSLFKIFLISDYLSTYNIGIEIESYVNKFQKCAAV